MKLKSWVVTTLLSLLIFAIVTLTVYTTSKVYTRISTDNNSYVMRDIVESDESIPVVKEVNENKSISKPFDRDNISIMTNFYKLDDTREIQEKSLIYYGNTYMPSTGILYGSEENFDVHSIFQGEVIKVEDNEVFGKTIEIKHENDIVSRYSSVVDVKVNVGDIVSSGDVIAKSGENKVISTCKNMLFFELISKGINVDPESFYGIDISKIG